MIQANELRIGNWVYDIDNDILQIGEILDIGVKFKNTSLSSRYTNIQPIPLTPEVLEKCGFLHSFGWQDTWWFKNIVSINLHNSKLYYNDLSNQIELKHLHQLQNLYFALTGDELEYNP